MNIERMRKIDYYLGIPLLFIVSLFGRLRRWIKPPQLIKPQNILFVELSEMGSAILAEPAMRETMQQHDARLFFCIFERNADVLKLLNLIDDSRIYLIRDDTALHFMVDSFRFRAWCLANEIDTLIDLELFSRFSALLAAWSAAANRLGFDACHNEGLYRGQVHTHRLWYNAHCHIAQNFMALVGQLATSEPLGSYAKVKLAPETLKISRLDIQAEKLRSVQQRLTSRLFGESGIEDLAGNNLIIVNINHGGVIEQRSWPRTHYVNLIQRVLDFDSQALVLLSGAVDAHVEAEMVMRLVDNERCNNITGLFGIAELPYLYTLAKLMVSCDSGPAHFAAVTDMPVITLFGPETPGLYRPLGRGRVLSARLACSPCVSAANHRKSDCSDNLCMQLITPEDVFTEVCSLYETAEVIRIAQ